MQEHQSRSVIAAALRQTCTEMLNELPNVPLAHWNESVFRYFLVRRLLAAEPVVQCMTEWNRVDLLLPGPAGGVLVEVKFFGIQSLCDSKGKVLRSKGGPSTQNYREYEEVVDKIRAADRAPWRSDCGGIAGGFLVLTYADPLNPSGARTYSSYYDALMPGGHIVAIESIVERAPAGTGFQFTCKLLEIAVDAAA